MEKNERRLAANRQRVQRHRAKGNNPPLEARAPPLTGAERARRYKARKRQAHIENPLS